MIHSFRCIKYHDPLLYCETITTELKIHKTPSRARNRGGTEQHQGMAQDRPEWQHDHRPAPCLGVGWYHGGVLADKDEAKSDMDGYCLFCILTHFSLDSKSNTGRPEININSEYSGDGNRADT